MSDTRKTMLLVALVLGLICLAFMLGVVGGGKGADWLQTDAIQGWFEPELVKAAEIQGCSGRRGSFILEGRCTLQVAPASAWSRQLMLSSDALVQLKTTTDADGRSMDMTSEVEPGKVLKLRIGKQGAVYDLQCMSPRCEVVLR